MDNTLRHHGVSNFDNTDVLSGMHIGVVLPAIVGLSGDRRDQRQLSYKEQRRPFSVKI